LYCSSNLPLRNTKEDHDLIPVPVSEHYCIFNSPHFRASDYTQSRSSLALYCSKYLVPKHTVHISVSSNGQVGTFVCNFSKRDQVCSGREYGWVESNWWTFAAASCGPAR
ncbi:hypothetical protein TOPH_00823, partial [Tolypocladium ophioglossoides CBS 100239]